MLRFSSRDAYPSSASIFIGRRSRRRLAFAKNPDVTSRFRNVPSGVVNDTRTELRLRAAPHIYYPTVVGWPRTSDSVSETGADRKMYAIRYRVFPIEDTPRRHDGTRRRDVSRGRTTPKSPISPISRYPSIYRRADAETRARWRWCRRGIILLSVRLTRARRPVVIASSKGVYRKGQGWAFALRRALGRFRTTNCQSVLNSRLNYW